MTSPELLKPTKQRFIDTLVSDVFTSLAHSHERKRISRHDTNDDHIMVHTEHNNGSDTVVYYFPGYRQHILPVKNAVQPHIGEAGTVRYFGSADGHYSDTALEDAILECGSEDDGMTIKVVGVSNGGKEALYQFAKPQLQQTIPYIESWNFDSTPSDFTDIRRLYQGMLIGGEMLNADSRICQRIFSAAMNLGLNKDSSIEELAYAVTSATAQTSLDASRSQLASLARPLSKGDSLARLGLQVGEFNYVASSYDAVVNTVQACARIEERVEHPVNVVVDSERSYGNHAGITDKPRSFAKILKYGYSVTMRQKEHANA